MRRLVVLIFAVAALFAGACGGGSGGSDKKVATNANATGSDHAAGGLSKVASSAGIADACGGRAAMNIGAAFAQASSNKGGDVDYANIASGFRKAASAAPAEIKADFTTLADAIGPYLDALQHAKGDYTKLAQDPAFMAAAQKLQDSKYTDASAHITAWFTNHCK